MPKHELYSLLLKFWWLLFVVANGACVGSLINVLVYRLPRGISVIWPPSACPNCRTKLHWKENFPVLGWLLLRGRCRTCRTPISPEYPLVEALTATMFGVVFVILAWMPYHAVWLGVNWGEMRPEWAWNPIDLMWPTILLVLVLVGSLIAMTIVDLRTFTIPAPLTTVPAALALVIHPLHAAWFAWKNSSRPSAWSWGYRWSIPTAANWGWLLAAVGACLGLAIGVGLVRAGLIKQSFSDYEAWEKEELRKLASNEAVQADPQTPIAAGADHAPASDPLSTSVEAPAAESPAEVPTRVPVPEAFTPDPGVVAHEQLPPLTGDLLTRVVACLGITMVLAVIGALVAPSAGRPGAVGLVIGILLGPMVAGLVLARRAHLPSRTEVITPLPPTSSHAESGVDPDQASSIPPVLVPDPHLHPTPSASNPAEAWIAYPHARREMVREMAFLAPAAGLALLGWNLPAWLDLKGPLPLWLAVLGGVLMGYIIGGGVVWAIRILGSLAAGKEAMGLGDVHMMAAVGACLGWIDATLAFFVAAFVGLYFVLVRLIWVGSTGRAMPYGPYLAAATLLVYLGKPWVDQGLTALLGRAVNLP
jgi:prepilin signal peptidase PulO-like enzyme (type II secretory pathway)